MSSLDRLRRRQRNKQRKINSKLRKKLYSNISNAKCYYCKEMFSINNLTIEHIVPLSNGGTNDNNNITLACGPCNQQRGKESWLAIKKIRSGQHKLRVENGS